MKTITLYFLYILPCGGLALAAPIPGNEVPKPFPVDVIHSWSHTSNAFGLMNQAVEFGWLEVDRYHNIYTRSTSISPKAGWLGNIRVCSWHLGETSKLTMPEFDFSLQAYAFDTKKLLALKSLKHVVALEGLALDAEATTELAKIGKLQLYHQNLLPLGDGVAKELARIPNLKRIYLSQSQLSDHDIEHFSGNQSVLHFDLSHTAITNRSAASLSQMKRLESLNVY